MLITYSEENLHFNKSEHKNVKTWHSVEYKKVGGFRGGRTVHSLPTTDEAMVPNNKRPQLLTVVYEY